jgi:hypothetical protein
MRLRSHRGTYRGGPRVQRSVGSAALGDVEHPDQTGSRAGQVRPLQNQGQGPPRAQFGRVAAGHRDRLGRAGRSSLVAPRRLDSVAGERDLAGGQVRAVVGHHPGRVRAGRRADQVVVDPIVVEQMLGRGGVGPVLLGPGDPLKLPDRRLPYTSTSELDATVIPPAQYQPLPPRPLP